MKKKDKSAKLKEKSIRSKEKTTTLKNGKDNAKQNGKIHIFQSIRAKLTLAFLVPVVLFTIVGILIYNRCSTALVQNSEDSINSTVSTISEYVSAGGQSVSLIADRLGSDAVTCFNGSPTNVQQNEAKLSVNNEATADYLVANISIIGPGYDSITNTSVIKQNEAFETFDATAEGQYVTASGEKSVWVGKHSELDEKLKLTGVYDISYVRSFYNKKNKFAGYIIVDVQSSYIRDIIGNTQLADGSVVGLVLDDGTEVVSVDDGFSFGENGLVSDIAGSDEGGSRTVTLNNKDYLFVYSPASNINATVCALVPKESILGAARSIQLYLIAALVLCAMAAILLGSYFAGDIGKTINKVNKNLQTTSSGDLTNVLHLSRRDEFSTLSYNIKNMTNSMKNLISKMSQVSTELGESSNLVEDNTNTLLTMTRTITQAVSYIDEGINRQSEDTANCLNQMEELAGRIAVVQSNASEINSITGDAQNAIENGINVVNELSEHVYDTTYVTKSIIEEIDKLSKDTEAINEIITTIEDISDETSLLSLNASIEAARAGEAGRGFAVVADNIRGFALRCTEAAGEIGNIVEALRGRMNEIIDIARRAENIVNSEEESLKTTVGVFDEIRTKVADLSGNMVFIVNSIEGIEKAKTDTLEAIESISSTSVETSASAGELNETAKKQLEAVEKLNNAVTVLQQNAANLDESVGIFKI